jgi:hypothetical protein
MYSLHKDNSKGEAELRGIRPKRLKIPPSMIFIKGTALRFQIVLHER